MSDYGISPLAPMARELELLDELHRWWNWMIFYGIPPHIINENLAEATKMNAWANPKPRSRTMEWSPVEIETLLRVYYLGSYRKQAHHTPATEKAIQRLLHDLLIDMRPMDRSDYVVTDRGEKMVKMLCSTPLPASRTEWVDPREV